ncbi:MAG: glycerol-3-phosphate 1-O-acyltransferase PlsY [Gemmatimonadota bacterium]
MPLALLGLAYLLGSIPTSYWVGKGVYGIDLRERGSGNLGATNALRVLGPRAAVPVMFVDIAKGWLPVWLFPRLDGEGAWAWALAYGAAALLGHVFSIWVRFRGGKGIATSTGIFIALAPAAVVAAFVAWGLVLWITRMVSLASVVAAVVLPVVVFWTARGENLVLPAFTAALSLFVIWAHRENLRRILAGTESRIGRGDEGNAVSSGRRVSP